MKNDEGGIQQRELSSREGTNRTEATNEQHLTPSPSPQSGEGGVRSPRHVLEWWGSLSKGERRLIWSVMKLLRGAKRSEVEEVARAAAKWESGIGCFIKLRLMGQAARDKPGRNGQRRVESKWLRVEGQRGPMGHGNKATPLPSLPERGGKGARYFMPISRA